MDGKNVRILVTTTFSITGKMSEFQHLLHCHNIDIAIVTETKLSEQSVASDVCVTGYITIRRDRN